MAEADSERPTREPLTRDVLPEGFCEQSPKYRYLRSNDVLSANPVKTTYRAFDTRNAIEVAWHTLHLNKLKSQDINRLYRYCSLIQKINSPRIIEYHTAWKKKDSSELVIITETTASGSLRAFLQKVKVLRWKIVKKWCRHLLRGLKYLHSLDPPVIHRDLSCEHIYINSGRSGDLRIGDLWLSTELSAGTSKVVSWQNYYAAPETQEGVLDVRSDIFSYGMCVVEMITREPPYVAEFGDFMRDDVPVKIQQRIKQHIYMSIHHARPPVALERITNGDARRFIERCLEHHSKRPDADTLLQDDFLQPNDIDDNEVTLGPSQIPERPVLMHDDSLDDDDDCGVGDSELEELPIGVLANFPEAEDDDKDTRLLEGRVSDDEDETPTRGGPNTPGFVSATPTGTTSGDPFGFDSKQPSNPARTSQRITPPSPQAAPQAQGAPQPSSSSKFDPDYRVKQGEETSVPSVKVVSLAEAPPRERSFSPINRTRNSFGTGRDVDIVGGLPAPRASGNTLRVTMQLNISGEEKDVSFEFCVGEDNYDTVAREMKTELCLDGIEESQLSAMIAKHVENAERSVATEIKTDGNGVLALNIASVPTAVSTAKQEPLEHPLARIKDEVIPVNSGEDTQLDSSTLIQQGTLNRLTSGESATGSVTTSLSRSVSETSNADVLQMTSTDAMGMANGVVNLGDRNDRPQHEDDDLEAVTGLGKENDVQKERQRVERVFEHRRKKLEDSQTSAEQEGEKLISAYEKELREIQERIMKLENEKNEQLEIFKSEFAQRKKELQEKRRKDKLEARELVLKQQQMPPQLYTQVAYYPPMVPMSQYSGAPVHGHSQQVMSTSHVMPNMSMHSSFIEPSQLHQWGGGHEHEHPPLPTMGPYSYYPWGPDVRLQQPVPTATTVQVHAASSNSNTPDAGGPTGAHASTPNAHASTPVNGTGSSPGHTHSHSSSF